ncbi:RNA-binding protein 47 [Tyrophagus putrescentiae]|nr:RNA-binding protein 47 [Tyrophagus putrescentiae]
MSPSEFEQFMKTHLPGFEIVSEKGQRIFRSKVSYENHPEFERMKKYEIFVSNLPNDLFENELLPFLCRAGKIFQIRLIMNFSGSSKGMAYVVYNDVESAFKAVEELNNEYIRASGNYCDRQVHVTFSVNNNRLVFYNIPPEKTIDEVKSELNQKLENVTDVKLFTDTQGVNATVTFSSHKAASEARRILIPQGSLIRIFNVKPRIEWAKPKDFKSLFVRFNCSFISRETIRKYFETKFSSFTQQISVSNVSLYERNAFVKFATFEQANYVLKRARQMPKSDFTVSEYVEIDEIAWPMRN